ncbi:hypothetical protein IF2G_01358 [Cordyceps javanica]|nr:hypothetical protein IF2G_01358 [Cordyceps javanica]
MSCNSSSRHLRRKTEIEEAELALHYILDAPLCRLTTLPIYYRAQRGVPFNAVDHDDVNEYIRHRTPYIDWTCKTSAQISLICQKRGKKKEKKGQGKKRTRKKNVQHPVFAGRHRANY